MERRSLAFIKKVDNYWTINPRNSVSACYVSGIVLSTPRIISFNVNNNSMIQVLFLKRRILTFREVKKLVYVL